MTSKYTSCFQPASDIHKMASEANEKPQSDRVQLFLCPLCWDVFRVPKILPCFHTFCEGCLQLLVSTHVSSTFPYPSCRLQTTVPPGGVSAFQSNFYLDPEDLEKARDATVCLKHPDRHLDLFCAQCDLPICLTCKMTKHDLHETQDIGEAATAIKRQLSEHVHRLKRCVQDVQREAGLVKTEQKVLANKRETLVTHIRQRQTTLKAAVDKQTDEALASLDKVISDVSLTLGEQLKSLQRNLQNLTQLQRQAQQALDSENASELVTVARELRSGRGSKDAVQKLTTKQMTTVCRPVLRFSATPDDSLQRIHSCIGTVVKESVVRAISDVSVVERFRCRHDPDTYVSHLCPLDDDKVFVSLEPYVCLNGALSYIFLTDGTIDKTVRHEINGRTASPLKTEVVLLSPRSSCVRPINQKNNFDGRTVYRIAEKNGRLSVIGKDMILKVEPVVSDKVDSFSVRCGIARAFDVDASEQLFVFLEDGETPDFQRRVQLYQRPELDAIATYSPPLTPFQPSDVCFYTLGGQEVLLVADELNDTIHVVNVQDRRLSFLHYLAPGCPLLVQPTALNTDATGRELWVACRDGRILTCTPCSQTKPSLPPRPSFMMAKKREQDALA